MTPFSDLISVLMELPAEQAAPLEAALASAIERCADRSQYEDSRRSKPVVEWDYLWDALGESFQTIRSLADWVDQAGDCWMFADRFRGRAWKVKPSEATRFARRDIYLVPCSTPSECFVSPHEKYVGSFLVPLAESSRIFFDRAHEGD